MTVQADSIAVSGLRALNRTTIDDPVAVRRLLSDVHRDDIELRSGIDGQINQRTAFIREVGSDHLVLSVENLSTERLPQVYFRFERDGSRYLFAADVLRDNDDGVVAVAIPSALHETERRSLPRVKCGSAHAAVWIKFHGVRFEAELLNRSQEGAAIRVQKEMLFRVGDRLELVFGGNDSRTVFAQVKSAIDRADWLRVGLSISRVPFGPLIKVERRDQVLPSTLATRARRGLQLYGAAVGIATGRLQRALGVDAGSRVEVLKYTNNLNQPMAAIVDRVGDARGGLAVIIPPAWGRTKETMLPLAAVIGETYAKANRAVSVVRFDGTNRRGESWIDPENRAAGREYLSFKFSQSVEDTQSTISYVANHPDLAPSRIILVTASLASVEGRKVMANNRCEKVTGWVSLVGMVDLHSGLRAASGGVDYAYGLLKGVKFGRHEVAGVVADMDITGTDVLANRLGLFEDARRDMATIRKPISWIHGRYDGWIELERVRELMSAGETSKRRLIEVPTGHQLRTSRQALETFQLVASEVSRLDLGSPLEPAVPRGRLVAAKRASERSRRPKVAEDLRHFWQEYVLGRTGVLGIELLAATSAYRNLMAVQLSRLVLEDGLAILDLGSGAGDFAVSMAVCGASKGSRVTSVDFLSDALRRGRSRAATAGLSVSPLLADLTEGAIPLASASQDRVIASLLISYVSRPDRLLAEIRRVLRPEGRLVLSAPRRDADLSKIYSDGLQELDPGRVRRMFGPRAEQEFSTLQRDLMNQGARLLTLEEEGWFRFWDLEEFVDLVRAAGFEDVSGELAFGQPPQVSVVSGRRK